MALQAFKDTGVNSWVDRTTNGWLDAITADVAILSRNYAVQSYDLSLGVPRNYSEHLYGLAGGLSLGFLEQTWSYRFTAQLVQYYRDSPRAKAVLVQWLMDYRTTRNKLNIIYGTADATRNALTQIYGVSENVIQKLEQIYLISQTAPVNFLEQDYSIKDTELAFSKLNQVYSLYPDPISVTSTPSTVLTIGGLSMQVAALNLEYTQGSYVGSCSITLANFGDWLLVDYEQPVVITIDAQEYHMVVISKSRSENVKSERLTVEAKSPAVLLDFPYATEISDDFIVAGVESVIVSALAALEGKSIVWEIPVDDSLTSTEIQVAGRSPLDCIKEIVNALGGIVQSYPDGSIHAVSRYVIDSDKYDSATPAVIYTSGEDFISLSDEADKRDGYNKYLVTNLTLDDGYTLDYEEVSPSHYEVRAYKVPWSSQAVNLDTSELTNVIITPSGVTTEDLTEEIEIVEGSGNVSKPCYGLITTNYKTSTNLGAVTVSEDGTVTTSASGNTLVELTYTTKYWLWDTTDVDTEDVQFILEVA